MDQWDEKLIENRLNQVLKEDEICAYHRYNFDVGWKPTKACRHPHEQHNGKKSDIGRPPYTINIRNNC